LLVATIVADACNFRVAAIQEVSSPAFGTRVVLPAMPADADTLSLLPSGDLGAQFIDDACDFVPRYPRILNSRPEAFFYKYVTVANPAGLTLMSTSPIPGLGISRSTISKSPPGLEICATCIVAVAIFVLAIVPPVSSLMALALSGFNLLHVARCALRCTVLASGESYPATSKMTSRATGAERKACHAIHQAAK
jgi:hypothetical protein